MVPSKSLNFSRPQFRLEARIHLNNECPPLLQGPATSEPQPRDRLRQERHPKPKSAGKLPIPECSAAK